MVSPWSLDCAKYTKIISGCCLGNNKDKKFNKFRLNGISKVKQIFSIHVTFLTRCCVECLVTKMGFEYNIYWISGFPVVQHISFHSFRLVLNVHLLKSFDVAHAHLENDVLKQMVMITMLLSLFVCVMRRDKSTFIKLSCSLSLSLRLVCAPTQFASTTPVHSTSTKIMRYAMINYRN